LGVASGEDPATEKQVDKKDEVLLDFESPFGSVAKKGE